MGGVPLACPWGVRRDMYGTAYIPTYYTVLRILNKNTYSCFTTIYQNWSCGLDSEGFCAPGRNTWCAISTYSFLFYFFCENVCLILGFGTVNKAYEAYGVCAGCIWMHTVAYRCIRITFKTNEKIHIYIHIYMNG